MPKYTLIKCARCGADARMSHIGVGIKARYIAKCTRDGDKHRTAEFTTARTAAKHWNAEQTMIERMKGDGKV